MAMIPERNVILRKVFALNCLPGGQVMSVKTSLLLYVCLLACVVLCGCTKDPQVLVTPFVLKAPQPHSDEAPAASGSLQTPTPNSLQAGSGSTEK